MSAQSVRIIEETGPLVAPLPFDHDEYQRRLDGVRRQMAEQGLDAFISFTPENMYYLSAHDSPGYYFMQASVVTAGQGPINVLRRGEATNTLGRGWKRLAVPYEDRDDPVETTLGLLRELGVADKTVGAEARSWFVSPERYEQLRQGIERAGGKLVNASGIVENMRVIKSAPELSYMRQGARAVERAMQVGVDATREGTNENEVAAQIVGELIRNGGEYAGLPPFITSGPRTSLVHTTWSGRVYEKGDSINYELPGVIQRYCAALFRCGTIGPPPPEVERDAAMILEVLDTVIAAIKPGATSDEVHQHTKRTFEKYGRGHLLAHRTGYSIGVNYPPDWGEGHIISIWEGDERPLQPGMTFHLVPGVRSFGHYFIVISETVLVTESGCDVLTNFPRELFVA